MGKIRTQDTVATAIRVHLAREHRPQQWLAEQMGKNPMWLSRRMNGATHFTTDDIDLVAGALGMSVLDLLDGAAA